MQYYSDPISGYVFRSMRDALRYVQTGEPGKKAFKPREKGDNDEDLEDDKSCVSPVMFGLSVYINLLCFSLYF